MSLNLEVDSTYGALDLRIGYFVNCDSNTKRVYTHIHPDNFKSLQSLNNFKSIFNSIKQSNYEEDLIIGMLYELIDYTLQERVQKTWFLIDFFHNNKKLIFNLRTTIIESKINDVEDLFLMLDRNCINEYLLSILYKYFSEDMDKNNYEIYMLLNAYNAEMACNLNYETNLLQIQISIDSSEL